MKPPRLSASPSVKTSPSVWLADSLLNLALTSNIVEPVVGAVVPCPWISLVVKLPVVVVRVAFAVSATPSKPSASSVHTPSVSVIPPEPSK